LTNSALALTVAVLLLFSVATTGSASAAPRTGSITRHRDAGIRCSVASATGTCDILNLVLGPIHLDLLGLVIDLDQVVLNITAQAAPGNLLGNPLCAVAGLLDGPRPLGARAGLLNRILAISASFQQLQLEGPGGAPGPSPWPRWRICPYTHGSGMTVTGVLLTPSGEDRAGVTHGDGTDGQLTTQAPPVAQPQGADLETLRLAHTAAATAWVRSAAR
jgi:hypothetical protein